MSEHENTIFEALRSDHETQRTLVDILVETSGDSEGRREIFDQLTSELKAHASAEERHFYVPLMEDDLTQEAARHSVAEHKELDDLIDELDTADMSSAHWLPTARKLRERLLHHLDEEEREVFPVAGKALSDSKKVALSVDYVDDMNRRQS